MRVAVWTLAAVIAVMLGYLIIDQWLPSGHGAVMVTSDPAGAQVWLDLKPTSVTTNGRLTMVTAGKHSVMVKLDTLEPDPVAQVVEIHRGRTETVHFRLVPPHYFSGSRPSYPPANRLPAVPPIVRDSAGAPPAAATPPPSMAHQDTLVRREQSVPEEKPEREPLQRTETAEVMEPSPTTGVLEIATSTPGAKIFVNDQPQPETTPASLKLPMGTYTLRVELDGYVSDPPDQTVSILRGTAMQTVFFSLAETAARQIVAETAPFAARIFINGAPVGSGRASTPREYGSYTVSFADTPGWKTPEPVHVSVTPSQPQPEVKGVYTRAFHVSVEVVNGKAVSQGNIRWVVGAYFEEDGARPSVSLGPKIRPIPDSQEFGWELGEGDPNRNPTGGDYVEFKFTLPSDVDPNIPLNLRLYLYRSNKRYPFSLKGQADLVVTVNGHRFLDGYRPQYGTESAGQNRFEEWTLTGMLTPGENRIMVRSGEENSLFNYLRKIEIL